MLLDGVDLAFPRVTGEATILRWSHSVEVVLVDQLLLRNEVKVLINQRLVLSVAISIGVLISVVKAEIALETLPWIWVVVFRVLAALDQIDVVSHDVELGDASIERLILCRPAEGVAHDGDQHVQEDNLNQERGCEEKGVEDVA